MENSGIVGLILALIAGLVFWFKNQVFTGQAPEANAGGSGSGSGGNGSGSGGFWEGVWGTDPGLDFSDLAAPDNVRRWSSTARKWADLRGLPWEIVLAVIWVESAGDPNAVGSADEKGLMQLKQIAVDDARQNGYQVPFDWFTNPESNVSAGTAYLALQRKRTGNIKDALKAYNQGFAGMQENPQLARTYMEKVVNKARELGWWG